MFSELRNDRRRPIGPADRLRDRDNSAEIGDGAAGIVDIAANVIPCWTPSGMETGVTLFQEEKFQRGAPGPSEIVLQEQSFSSLHSGRSLAWDHFHGNIDDPCGVIADFWEL